MSDTRTYVRDPGAAGPTTRTFGPVERLARALAGRKSGLDLRLVYRKTDEGHKVADDQTSQISLAARRLLLLIDGIRPLARMPAVFRVDELPRLVSELEEFGLVIVTGISSDEGEQGTEHPDMKLSSVKRSLLGAVEAELGPQGSVLEARLQDCVNLVVMRSVLREVIALVDKRAGAAAADRIADKVKAHGPL